MGHPHARTGQALGVQALLALAEQCAAAHAWLLIDESYAPFTTLPVPPRHPALVRLLQPGLAHGLLGAAPAYALAGAERVAALNDLAPLEPVTAGTAAVLAHLPAGASFLAQTLPRVAQHAQELAQHLARLGRVERHGTPFLTLRVGHAAQVAASLLERGLAVQDCAAEGHPDLIRVATRLPGENATLVRALAEVRPTTGRHG